eukprot:TRINITY_DN4812_c1_g1_i1.p1 TRINITY_DN4812_c1_g1~~TRINITY_DN4812_c1_g1_i1.p1  ORF type:complete len:198 (-),score=34.98 TRINITY_DN4812_c1_g1_i1:42-635(-)
MMDAETQRMLNERLMDAVICTSLFTDAVAEKRVRDLLDRGANANSCDSSGMTAMHWACSSSDRVRTTITLLERGASVSAKDKNGFTPLHELCCQRKQPSLLLITQLLSSGANINERDNDGWMPIHWACYVGDKILLTHLLISGANAKAVSSNLITPLHCVHLRQDRKKLLHDILTNYGADPTAKDSLGKIPTEYSVV